MNNSITNRQVAFLIFSGVVGYGIVKLPNDAASAAGTESWIPLVFNTMLVVLFMYFITYLGYNYENQTLFEYSQKLIGKTIGKIITVIYILYFLFTLSILVRSFCDILTITFLPRTPVWAVSLLLLLVTSYALTKDLKTIARLVEIYIFLTITGFLFIHTLIASQGRIINIRPLIGSENIGTYVKASYDLFFPFLGTEALMFIPISKIQNKGVMKYSTLIMAFIGFLYIFIVETTISVIGVKDMVHYYASTIKVVRGISLPYLEILTRPDGIYMMIWTLSLFSCLCVSSYCMLSPLKKFFKNTHPNIIIFSIIGISFILSQIPKTPMEMNKARSYLGYFGIFTLIIVPSILFIIAKVKKNAG